VSADVPALRARRIGVDSLSAALAAEVRQLPGIAQVFTPATLAAAPATDGGARLWRRSLPTDYGWLVCALPQSGYVWSTGGLRAEHGGGHAEDISVPIVFLVPGATPQHPARAANTVDIAPTLAALLGLKPTEALDGVVLPEVLSHPAIAGRPGP
jgi:arylsulfatase A-like enzyme